MFPGGPWRRAYRDQKINATNSWNFALIDYFHDMSLLKEGDGVNFQRASCTLDGCVKIYTSRVDSVATETGKLLSGLAESGNKKKRGGNAEDNNDADGDEEEGEDGTRKRRKRAQRSSEATLVTSFAQLQLKKMELEFSVDPLFKKASADFDEGGAKGLLLNHLAIDSEGRIVFDSSDDAQDSAADDTRLSLDPQEGEAVPAADEAKPVDIDISNLAAKYFPDLSLLDHQDVCPSLKNFDLSDSAGTADLPFLKAPEDWRQEGKDSATDDQSRAALDDENGVGFDDDVGFGGFDLPPETGFGEGGEAWAKEVALEPQMHTNAAMGTVDSDAGHGGDDFGAFETSTRSYGISIAQSREDEQKNILSYFDQALQKDWAGPEHWRIRRIKDVNKAGPPVARRKEKEPFEVDFSAPMTQAVADALYTPATSNSTISLPKTQWKSKSRNLLPDDKHFNSKQLLRLFLKPKARMGARRNGRNMQQPSDEKPPEDVDESYWAKQGEEGPPLAGDDDAPPGNYDADFFQDDGLGMAGGANDDDDDDEFADARDHFSPQADEAGAGMPPLTNPVSSPEEGAFGANFVTQNRRVRPEYVQYARAAKKVDVRRLKEELWRSLALEQAARATPSKRPVAVAPDGENETSRFTQAINGLQTVYPKQAMADISTSYCFICLLHLANEKGLVISNEMNFEDLSIRKDLEADLSIGG